MQLLLKDKLKEIKTLSSKNSKLEAKYIDLFKENKSVKKEGAMGMELVAVMVESLGHDVKYV